MEGRRIFEGLGLGLRSGLLGGLVELELVVISCLIRFKGRFSLSWSASSKEGDVERDLFRLPSTREARHQKTSGNRIRPRKNSTPLFFRVV